MIREIAARGESCPPRRPDCCLRGTAYTAVAAAKGGADRSSLKQVLDRIRQANPKYNVDLLEDGLVHVYPPNGTADLVGRLAIGLREFFLPPDDCLPQQMIDYTGSLSPGFSYTPDLSEYLMRKKLESNQRHGNPVFGIVGDFMGDCKPSHHRHEPIYHNITVREALNLMAIRSLEVARGTTDKPRWARPKPISWKYRFRSDRDADTGLGGVPIFQTF